MQKTATRPIFRRSYLNLDAIFGHVFTNLTGEPLTPTKIATFYLLRILFQTHFGFRHERSEFPQFDQIEKKTIFIWLYGLMATNQELSYEEFRIITRVAFRESREINRNFYAAMEQIGQGLADITLGIEDEFYTHKHSKDPNLPRDDPTHDAIDQACRDDLQFSSTHSFMYRWMKRILAQYARTTSAEMFEINEAMRAWVTSNEESTFYPGFNGVILPNYVDCSMRAREWIADTIHYIQKNPRYTLSYDELLNCTRTVQQRHPDVVEAFLLESVVQLQLKDFRCSLKTMKSFFELSMFELNENMQHAIKTHRLAVPNQTPLMYAPILHARICKLAGDYQMARNLLRESLQQAQLRNDEICHQMANIELHTVDILGGRALLEDRNEKGDTKLKDDRRILRKALRHIDDLHGHTRSGPCCLSSEEDFELVAEMDSYGKMLMLFKKIAEGRYNLIYSRIAETGISCPVGNDHGERGRKVSAYGYALMTSNMIRNGMYEQAKATAGEMLSGNLNSNDTDTYVTESYAVGAANLAYSFAGTGNYDAALATINKMREVYIEELSWQCHRHVAICAAVINFERHFLKNNYKACNVAVLELVAHSDLECKLRQGLLLSALGRFEEAVEVLNTLKVTDVHGRIRIHMQLGCIYTANQFYSSAEKEYAVALNLAENTTFKNIEAMVKRRMATMMICRNQFSEARAILDECKEAIDCFGSFTEKACYYMTAIRAARFAGDDPRIWLKQARSLNRKKQWPGYEKLVLAEIAAMHDPKGLMPNPNRLSQVREQFGKLETDHPGRCEWLLI